jgi:hypothetical protein
MHAVFHWRSLFAAESITIGFISALGAWQEITPRYTARFSASAIPLRGT